MDSHKPRVQRSEGITPTERYLHRLCDKSILSLWTYPGIYRDQGRGSKGDGKEVCDLLVVFDDHIIVFSDKECEFPNTGKLELDWSRWFRRSVLESANQVWGAERWIKSHPTRLFIDRACSQPFPLDLPNLATAHFHRIVVAHNASRRCQDVLGGSGSLMLMPSIIGSMHYEPNERGVTPFAIGQIDPTKGYVHVLDDTSLDILLGTLDTITDFVKYLTKKERLVSTGLLGAAAGEEDLLGYYLGQLNDANEHDFVFVDDADVIAIDEGFWEDFRQSPERKRKLQADEVSYTWDRIIEKFAHHIFSGTSHYNSHPRIADQVVPLRFMAREPRVRRRMLSASLMDFIEKTPTKNIRATRVMKPSSPGDPYYVFLLLSVPNGIPNQTYRELRRTLLECLCTTTKLEFPDALDIVGFATEPGIDSSKTEDAFYLDTRGWTPEYQAQALEDREALGLLKNMSFHHSHCKEYPEPQPKSRIILPSTQRQSGSLRNSQCSCGSGLKFKRCCGRPGR